MIGVKFNGRLGNQLFQYFFLLYLKSRDKSKFYFFPNPHHAYLSKYFDLGTWHNLTLGSRLYSVFTRSLPKLFKFREISVHNFFAPKSHNPLNCSIYNGYFQSDFYIKKIPHLVFPPIKPFYRKQFEDQFGQAFSQAKTIVVHIRRTDYLAYGKRDISLPVAYFKTQLYAIPNLDDYRVYFVSDDMDFVKREFPARANYVFSSNSEIIDFQLIMHADIAIISNSTFAWWAAYMSPKKNEVIAPKNWFGFRIGREHPRGIMTDRFHWREVLPVQPSDA